MIIFAYFFFLYVFLFADSRGNYEAVFLGVYRSLSRDLLVSGFWRLASFVFRLLFIVLWPWRASVIAGIAWSGTSGRTWCTGAAALRAHRVLPRRRPQVTHSPLQPIEHVQARFDRQQLWEQHRFRTVGITARPLPFQDGGCGRLQKNEFSELPPKLNTTLFDRSTLNHCSEISDNFAFNVLFVVEQSFSKLNLIQVQERTLRLRSGAAPS